MAKPIGRPATPVPPDTRFGQLTVIGEVPIEGREPHRRAQRRIICRCDCSTVKVFNLVNLQSGNSRSCGCSKRKGGSRWLTRTTTR